MIRRTIIFVTVLSAYLLMLGHDIIPHHHHHDHVNIEAHHEHHDDSEDNDDHEGLPEFFAQFVHAPYQAPNNTSVSFVIDYKDYSTDPVNILAAPPAPPGLSVDQPDPPEDVGKIRGSHFSSASLRAPPVC